MWITLTCRRGGDGFTPRRTFSRLGGRNDDKQRARLKRRPCCDRLSNGFYFELDALVLLNATDDIEEVAGVGIPVWPEHAA